MSEATSPKPVTCTTCGQPVVAYDCVAACRTCEAWWFVYPNGTFGNRKEFEYGECVSCGRPIVSVPMGLNDHKCSPAHEAARRGASNADRDPKRPRRSLNSRLSEGFASLRGDAVEDDGDPYLPEDLR